MVAQAGWYDLLGCLLGGFFYVCVGSWGGFVFVAARYVLPLAREEGVLLDGGAATPL